MDVQKKTFVVVDYGMGNLHSVVNAFTFLGTEVIVSNTEDDITKADAIILPGVGAFGKAMSNLSSLGIIKVLHKQIMEKKVPFLGICLGMQLIAESSEEGGHHKGFGWIAGRVIKIPVREGTRLPHIGWNDIVVLKNKPLFSKIKRDFNFYFVHSFHLECDESYISAKCTYDVDITAAVQRENIFATQFHPEKSQENGLRVLKGFIDFVEANGRGEDS